MAYLDIDPQETEWTTLNGDFKQVNRETDIMSDILLTDKGGFKYAPTIGGSARSYLNSNTRKSVIKRAFTVSLKAAGFSKPVVDVGNFPSEIKVNNEQVLSGID